MNWFIGIGNQYADFLDILGFVQGIVLGMLLLFFHKKNKRNSFYLGIFLILFSVGILEFTQGQNVYDPSKPFYFLFPLNFSWFLFVLFLFYTIRISVFSNQKINKWLLIPGLIAYSAQLFIYFLPFPTKLEISKSFWCEFLFSYLGIFYSWCIGVWNLRILYLHRVEVFNSFSKLHFRKLEWMGIFIIYALVSPIVTHFLYFLIPELGPNYRLIFSVLDIIALFWIGLHGLVQKNVTSILNQYEPIFDPLSENAIASTLEEDPEQMGKLMEQIDNYMYSSEPFCHSDLTITDLAQELKMHPKKISTVINTVNHENFNCYVNNFRVKKAERILNSDKFKNLSIEGIAKEAGFHSRSAFYRAFRKFTGTTPTKYRQQLI